MTEKDAAKLIRRSIYNGLLDFFCFLGCVLIGATLLSGWLTPYDDTDPPRGRSGLEVKTDCLTGLQYLASANGGLTPRLDITGAHIAKDCK